MRKILTFFAVLIGIAVMLALSFGLTWFGIEWDGFFNVKRANMEREVHRSTDSYDEGMVQQLSRFRLEYIREKDSVAKSAISGTVRQMFAKYPSDRLPSPELRAFLKECMNR